MELLTILLVVLFIIIATVKFKLNPVFSLILAALISGFLLGLTPQQMMVQIGEGFGKTLSGIGLVIAFGSVIGIFLEKTGSTKVLTDTILKWVGFKRSPLAINLAGFVVSIPVFCDSGFIILSSLNKTLSKKSGLPVLFFAIALASGLYAAHVFVPPTPGPLAAAAILEADLGTVLILGLLVAIPVSLTGYFWARFVSGYIKTTNPGDDKILTIEEATARPTALQAFLPLVVPLVLIALKSVANYPTKPVGEGILFQFTDFVGNPIVALLFGVFLAFSLGRKHPSKERNEWIVEALKQAGLIVLITGAGGAFGAILRTVDFAAILDLSTTSGVGGLLICFGIAAALKTAQGSSTVSIITTAAIAAPLLSTFGLVSVAEKALGVLAIGAGAMTVSHINDSYFWVVSQFSDLDVKNALKGHSLATLFQGLVGIALIIVLYLIMGG
ncbi:GntP family permease [Flagellimonas lutaonensis]|uniref:Gluconate transporter n=1 Tax=Flagellimonas lutaonensis TaxID=516051 RepID=A0A0D5YND2_9FLAO|nr:GntP family permease [Allomuricauda lutaonensis]AKA33712.1 Gluconate transporter [Allomuricauda lutaonensis]